MKIVCEREKLLKGIIKVPYDEKLDYLNNIRNINKSKQYKKVV